MTTKFQLQDMEVVCSQNQKLPLLREQGLAAESLLLLKMMCNKVPLDPQSLRMHLQG